MASSSVQDSATRQVVFIDPRVPDLQDLISGANPGARVFVLAPGSDGLRQIADSLARNNLTDLSAIQIVAHGRAGEIQLGSTTVDSRSLASHADVLAGIGATLAPGGGLALYGCNVAQGATGARFIADLSTAAGGVDVAAATHIVGSADHGGNWTLDYAIGAIQARNPFTDAALANFHGALATTPGLYFPAIANGATGPDLFVLHALSTPTEIPIRTDPGASNGSSPGEGGGFHELNGKLYFFADTPAAVGGLFQLAPDGTLTPISGATSTFEDAHFTYFDHDLYFRALTSVGDELVRLGGNGVVTPIDVNQQGNGNSFAGQNGGFGVFNGSLYFSADTPTTGVDLFRLDAGSTTPVAIEINPGTSSSFAGVDDGFFTFNNGLYFNAFSAADNQFELFRLAANSNTPTVVRDAGNNIITHEFGVTSSFHQFAGSLYTDDVKPGQADTLIKIGADGVATALQYQGSDLNNAGQFGGFVEYGNDMYFTASTPATNTDLFKIDAAGHITALNLTNSGSFSAFDANLVSGFVLFAGALYFDAYNAGGDALYKINAGGTVSTVYGNGTTQAGVPGGFQIFDNSLYFSAFDPNKGAELFRLDTNGTITVYDIKTDGSGNSNPGDPGGFAAFLNPVTLEDASHNVIRTFSTIQAAVNAATNGDTVLIAAGTYTEQVTVDGKAITIAGAGQGQTIILSPDAANLVANIQNPGEFHDQDPLVGIVNGANVTIKNLTIDGNNQGVVYATGADHSGALNGGDLVGIEALNSSLTVSNVHVTGTEDLEPGNGGLQGGQGNKGIIVDDRNSSTQTFTITGSTIDNFQKDGILMEGKGLTVDVNNNTITGVGTGATKISQNLIELDFGASGSITHNNVTGVSDGAFGSIGILAFESGTGVTVSSNIVSGAPGNVNSLGIFFAGNGGGLVEGNTISNQSFALLEDGGSPDFLGFSDPFNPAITQDNNTYTGDGLNYWFFAGATSTTAWTVNGTGGPDTLQGGANNDVFIVMGGAPNGNAFVGNAGIDAVLGYGAGYHVAVQGGQWVVTNGTATDTLTGIEKVVIAGRTFDLVDQLGANTGGFQSIQAAVNAAQPGDIVVANAGTSPVNIQVTVDNLTFEPSQGYSGITLTLASGVRTVTLADYAAGQGTPVTVHANNLGDKIIGNGAGDHFVGGTGADTFVVLNTATTIDTVGINDVIDLPGLAFAAGATATYDATNHILSVTSNGVTDMLTVTNVGFAHIAALRDGAGGTQVGQAAAPNDFNVDARSDILWRHSSGTTVLWEMSDATRIADTNLSPTPLDWTFQATGDFNGDGHSDILWRDTNGTTVLWEMNGAQKIADLSLGVIPTSWHIQGLGDFNGDGKSDILWRNDNGSTELWEMNGGQKIADLSLGTISTGWHILGTGDFNGDGKVDILWRNTSNTADNGKIVLWEMNGANRILDANVAQLANDWHFQTIGDYNGDGKSDIVWRNDAGTTVLWEMNGAQKTLDANLSTVTTDWTLLTHHYDIV